MASTSPSLQVELKGTNYTFPGSEQMQVSLLVNQLIPLSHGPTNPGSNPGSTRVNAFTCAN